MKIPEDSIVIKGEIKIQYELINDELLHITTTFDNGEIYEDYRINVNRNKPNDIEYENHIKYIAEKYNIPEKEIYPFMLGDPIATMLEKCAKKEYIDGSKILDSWGFFSYINGKKLTREEAKKLRFEQENDPEYIAKRKRRSSN